MSQKKLPFRSSIRVSESHHIPYDGYAVQRDMGEILLWCAAQVDRGSLTSLLESIDERVAIGCLVHADMLSDRDLQRVVERQLDMSDNLGELWTPFLDQLCFGIPDVHDGLPASGLQHNLIQRIDDRLTALCRWIRRRKSSSAILELRPFESLVLRRTVISAWPYTPDVLAAMVRMDVDLLLLLQRADWTYESAEWVLHCVADNKSLFGELGLVARSVRLVSSCATQARKAVDGCMALAYCVDGLTAPAKTLRRAELLSDLDGLEALAIDGLAASDTLGHPTRSQVTRLLRCDRAALRMRAMAELSRLTA